MGLEAFRQHRITAHQFRGMPGFATGNDPDGFLKQHEVWLDYYAEDLDTDRETAERLWRERQAEPAGETARQRIAGRSLSPGR